MRQAARTRLPLKAAVLVGFAALAAGCDSTIHKQSNIGGVDTLALDAKQRMVFVGDRQAGHGERITCTEPMPDALVARAAVLSASGNANLAGGTPVGGNVSGGSAESAASIGFRNESVQMLRDGYYRLCEAYMNGALSKFQYQSMIMNADTFMAVISALQTLGNAPVAQNLALQAGSLTVTTQPAGTPGAPAAGQATGVFQPPAATPPANPSRDKGAVVAGQIVRDYLAYRRWLSVQLFTAEQQERKDKMRQHRNIH
ncbi:MAG: hypothetical protein Q7T81_09975 [Pseudolabrys sp.]|nr:hypothetical protein [Pseudolabrys sp.]